MTQTLIICLPWMYEVVWGGCQPQPWHYGITSTPQVTLSPKILGQPGHCNGIKVPPYALETAYQRLKHFECVCYGCLNQSEVDISLNHDIMASFSLCEWPWVPKSGANLASVMVLGCNHMPLRLHTNGSNTLHMPNMNVWRSLKWISASTMMLWLWHHFYSTSVPES